MVDTRWAVHVGCGVVWDLENPTIGYNMQRVGFSEVVLGKFRLILKKDRAYRNTDMLSSKWTPISRKCTKFNGIYNKLSLQKQSGANNFDVFKAARE